MPSTSPHRDALGPAFTATGGCWVCGGLERRPYHEAIVDFSEYAGQDPELAAYTGVSVRLVKCAACGFGQPEHLPALPRFFERMYDQLWSPAWVQQEFEGTYKDVIFSRILQVLDRRVARRPRRLLDVGAHAGRFLSMADDAGWAAEGIELNPRTAAYAARRTGLAVHHANAEDLRVLDGLFDAVTLTDVLEHMPRPVAMLERLRRVMRGGGWLAIKVPSGPAQRVKETCRSRIRYGYRPRLADNLVHVSHFSPRSLRLALERAGFDHIRIEVGAPECPRGRQVDRAARLVLYYGARALPFGVETPIALHLQAFARRPPDR